MIDYSLIPDRDFVVLSLDLDLVMVSEENSVGMFVDNLLRWLLLLPRFVLTVLR